jgi:hypothetical protein
LVKEKTVLSDSDDILYRWKLYWLPQYEKKKGNRMLGIEKGARKEAKKEPIFPYVYSETENVLILC